MTIAFKDLSEAKTVWELDQMYEFNISLNHFMGKQMCPQYEKQLIKLKKNA